MKFALQYSVDQRVDQKFDQRLAKSHLPRQYPDIALEAGQYKIFALQKQLICPHKVLHSRI